MEFKKAEFGVRAAPSGEPVTPAAAPAPGAGALPAPPKAGQALLETSQNLLKHIPGEASGFYLMAADAFTDPKVGTLGFLFVLALILLILVRWLAGASRGIMIATCFAFLLWMFVLEKGFLHAAFPNLVPAPMGLILAVFYSTAVTALASAGKIR